MILGGFPSRSQLPCPLSLPPAAGANKLKNMKEIKKFTQTDFLPLVKSCSLVVNRAP